MVRQFRRVSSGPTHTAAQLWSSRHSQPGLRPKPSPSLSSPVRVLPHLHQRRLWLGSQGSPQLSTNGLRGKLVGLVPNWEGFGDNLLAILQEQWTTCLG